MNSELYLQLQFLEKKKFQLDAERPLPHHTLVSLQEKLWLEWTYHSNAIEGNTLTLRETKVALEGITVGGKSLREHVEAINHSEAIQYVEKIILNKEPLTEWQIKNIHGLVLKGINDAEAGRYRNQNVTIAGASTTPPDFLHLQEEMTSLITWYNESNNLHPIERAAELHTRFVKIHPFIDGNGRTGRLLLNFELMKDGYPPAIIRKEDRLTYYDVLDNACVKDNYDGITKLTAEAIDRSLNVYFDLLHNKSRTSENIIQFNEKSYAQAEQIASIKDKYKLAEDGKAYRGTILGVTEFHVVQNIGRVAVIHLKANLDRIPGIKEMVNIKYSNGRGFVEPRANIKPTDLSH